MKYDFTTYSDRSAAGSLKYLDMKSKAKSIPENVIPLSIADMEFVTAPEVVGA